MWTQLQPFMEAEQAYRRERIVSMVSRRRGYHVGRHARQLVVGPSRHHGERLWGRGRRPVTGVTHAA